jgi:large subunit ribosomal protein L4
VHGPQPRSYEQRTPKKMKTAALRGALSDRARHGRVHVVDSLVDGETPKTKAALAALAAVIGAPTAHVLVVVSPADELTRLSLRNATGVHLLAWTQLNTRDVLVSDYVVFTAEALDGFVARSAGKGNGAGTADDTAYAAVSAEAADEPAEAPAPKASRPKPKQEDDQQ